MNTNPIRLYEDSGYWKVKYYDQFGKRRTKSLGSTKRIRKRQARVLAERFMAKLHVDPGRYSLGKALPFGQYLQRYLDSRTDIKKGTLELHERTASYLLEYFGESIRIDRITRAAAADWRSSLAKGKASKHEGLAEGTVCQHIRNAKTIFNHALRDDLVLFNPFDRLSGIAPEPDKNWRYVSPKDFEKLLDACPSIPWRALLSLCRLAGLRQGEALNLPWSAVDWEHRRLEIVAEKTARRRIVPIEPDLFNLLLEAFSKRDKSKPLVIPRRSLGQSNLWRDFGVICKRAGLQRWASWCQVLRRNRETDWAQKYPQYVVSAWLGHDIRVSSRHYLQVPEELYDKVAGISRPQPARLSRAKTRLHKAG